MCIVFILFCSSSWTFRASFILIFVHFSIIQQFIRSLISSHVVFHTIFSFQLFVYLRLHYLFFLFFICGCYFCCLPLLFHYIKYFTFLYRANSTTSTDVCFISKYLFRIRFFFSRSFISYYLSLYVSYSQPKLYRRKSFFGPFFLLFMYSIINVGNSINLKTKEKEKKWRISFRLWILHLH